MSSWGFDEDDEEGDNSNTEGEDLDDIESVDDTSSLSRMVDQGMSFDELTPSLVS